LSFNVHYWGLKSKSLFTISSRSLIPIAGYFYALYSLVKSFKFIFSLNIELIDIKGVVIMKIFLLDPKGWRAKLRKKLRYIDKTKRHLGKTDWFFVAIVVTGASKA